MRRFCRRGVVTCQEHLFRRGQPSWLDTRSVRNATPACRYDASNPTGSITIRTSTNVPGAAAPTRSSSPTMRLAVLSRGATSEWTRTANSCRHSCANQDDARTNNHTSGGSCDGNRAGCTDIWSDVARSSLRGASAAVCCIFECSFVQCIGRACTCPLRLSIGGISGPSRIDGHLHETNGLNPRLDFN